MFAVCRSVAHWGSPLSCWPACPAAASSLGIWGICAGKKRKIFFYWFAAFNVETCLKLPILPSWLLITASHLKLWDAFAAQGIPARRRAVHLQHWSALKNDSAVLSMHLNFSVFPSFQEYILLTATPAGLVCFLLVWGQHAKPGCGKDVKCCGLAELWHCALCTLILFW